MKVFKSHIIVSIVELCFMTLGYSALIYLVSHYLLDFSFSQISSLGWRIILFLYLLACYCYVGFSNNDIILYDDRLEIINKNLFFKKHHIFPLTEIRSVQFRHDWTDTIDHYIKSVFLGVIIKLFIIDWVLSFLLPHNYKWIKVITDKEYTFYCFGLEFEHYDSHGTTFDELFYDLAKKKINVSWTDHNEVQYPFMNSKTEERL